MRQSKFGNWISLVAAIAIGTATLGALTGLETAQAQFPANRPPPNVRQPSAVKDLVSALDQTAAVVEGLVADIQYDYSDAEGPWTRVILSDVHALFGSAPPLLEIRHFGGPLPNGRMMVATELPVFVHGKRYVVFLRNTAWNVSPVVGDLALRLETVDGAEVLVNSDGQAVIGVGSRGVEMGAALFEAPGLDGRSPQSLGRRLSALEHKPLDRQSFVEALDAAMATHGLSVAGPFYDHPAGEFNWRAQRTAPSSRHPAPTGTPSPQSGSQGPVIDTSGPRP